MTDLADFLLARIVGDEEAARAATPGPWVTLREKGLNEYVRVVTAGEDSVEVLAAGGEWGNWWLEAADADLVHLTSWDPVRVLAEATAKRKVITHQLAVLRARWDELPDAERQAQPDWLAKATTTVLRALALPWVDHPDFRQGWALRPPACAGSRSVAASRWSPRLTRRTTRSARPGVRMNGPRSAKAPARAVVTDCSRTRRTRGRCRCARCTAGGRSTGLPACSRGGPAGLGMAGRSAQSERYRRSCRPGRPCGLCGWGSLLSPALPGSLTAAPTPATLHCERDNCLRGPAPSPHGPGAVVVGGQAPKPGGEHDVTPIRGPTTSPRSRGQHSTRPPTSLARPPRVARPRPSTPADCAALSPAR